jgi:hypothetical protein
MIDTNKDMRWMTNNFLETGYGSFAVTSEDANYPKENMLDGAQRTKVFKFGGRFLIEAGVNDKLYISGVTYTIPAADYGSLNALLLAINTLLSGIASTSYNADNEPYIVSIFPVGTKNLQFSNRTTAAWDTLGFSQIVDVSGTTGVIAAEGRNHWPYEEITIDFGYQAPIGFLAMISDLAEELKIPEGATITLLGNTVNSFVAPPLNVTIPWYTTGAFRFLDDQTDDAWRYVKIRITCPSGGFIPQIGYLYVGDYSNFDSKNIGTGFDWTYEDASELSAADAGQVYGNSRTAIRVLDSLTVGLARPEHGAFLKRIYKLKGLVTPFFVALDPTSYLSDTDDEYLAYVRFTAPPRGQHIIRNIFELQFAIREAL